MVALNSDHPHHPLPRNQFSVFPWQQFSFLVAEVGRTLLPEGDDHIVGGFSAGSWTTTPEFFTLLSSSLLLQIVLTCLHLRVRSAQDIQHILPHEKQERYELYHQCFHCLILTLWGWKLKKNSFNFNWKLSASITHFDRHEDSGMTFCWSPRWSMADNLPLRMHTLLDEALTPTAPLLSTT